MPELVTARVARPAPPTPRTSAESIGAGLRTPVPVVPAPALPTATSPGRVSRPRWAAPQHGLVDAGLVLACAGVLAVLGFPAPLPVVAGAVVGWPLLLAALGTHGAGPLGRGVTSGDVGVLRAVVVAAVACWLLHPLTGATTGAERVAPLLVLLGAAAALGAALTPLARPVRVVLAGAAADVSAAFVELGPCSRFDVVGVCLPPRQDVGSGQGLLPLADGIPLSVGLLDSVDVAADQHADALVLFPGGEMSQPVVRRLLWRAGARDLPAYVATGLLDVAPGRASVVQGMGLDLLHVRPAPLRGARRLVKGALERSGALLALVLLSPVLLGVAIMIRRETPGAALFRQQRVGRDGHAFTMYKFRTMSRDAEAEGTTFAAHDGVLHKLRCDPRTTPLGRVLRRYSVDELPQLWNVVTGQMALVGPRPALPDEVARYDVDARRRLAVKPGLTGLWQVSGRSDLTWEESVRLDVRYVDNWSLRLDASILVRTVHAVLGHRGAY